MPACASVLNVAVRVVQAWEHQPAAKIYATVTGGHVGNRVIGALRPGEATGVDVYSEPRNTVSVSVVSAQALVKESVVVCDRRTPAPRSTVRE